MGYRKRYEDSYLDEEENELEDVSKTDAERIIGLLQKESRTLPEEEKIKLLTDRLLMGARMPGDSGKSAVEELIQIAKTYGELGAPDISITLWSQISDIAGVIGNRDLYYRCMEEMEALNPAIYDEHHDGGAIRN